MRGGPVGDLVVVHVELLEALGQGLLTTQGGHGHLGFELRRMVASGRPMVFSKRLSVLDTKGSFLIDLSE